MDLLTFALQPRAPFRLDLTAWALRRRPENLIDRWDGRAYERVLVLEGMPASVSVVQKGRAEVPQLQVTVSSALASAALELLVKQVLERSLGLELDLAPFYQFASTDARLQSLAMRFRGFRPPRFPTLFEALVNAIACQQASLTLGIRLLSRLAEAYGVIPQQQPAAPHAFPEPAGLAILQPEALRPLGFSHQKARALIELSRTITGGVLDLDSLAGLDDAAAVARLCQLRGVGRWTAEYVLLRGLGRLHVFPGDDVGARNNLRRWLALTEPLDYDGVHGVLAPWQCYGGLIYLHLLLEHLSEAGYIQAEPCL